MSLIDRGCSDCVRPSPPAESFPPNAAPPPYTIGHVGTIFESLATPAEHILINSPGIVENPSVLQRCRDALATIDNPSSLVGKFCALGLQLSARSGQLGLHLANVALPMSDTVLKCRDIDGNEDKGDYRCEEERSGSLDNEYVSIESKNI